jgi:hypothetical protein
MRQRAFPGPAATSVVAALLLLLGGAGALAAAETRTFRSTFPEGEEIRLANLAGRVEIVPGRGDRVVVEVTVHADGSSAAETRRLLDGMEWVRGKDRKGRREWALSYPVDQYRAFHYPRPNGRSGDSELPSFLRFLEDHGHSQTTYRGERVRIYGQKRPSTPTLYANLKVAMPAGANLAVRNVVGPVRGGDLQGRLVVDTGSGSVRLGSFSGDLTVDTGSGDVVLGAVKGQTLVDTGSGDVTVSRFVGNGKIDTGSGDVTVEQVSAGGLEIDTGSGDVTVRNGLAGRVVADTGSGDVRILDIEPEDLVADTGSGNVIIQASLVNARRIVADTGSGNVRIYAGPDASFELDADQGSGRLTVGYPDASLRHSGRKVVGARRGDGQTKIRVDTGSGNCVIAPRGDG